jgi:hypothetical protein
MLKTKIKGFFLSLSIVFITFSSASASEIIEFLDIGFSKTIRSFVLREAKKAPRYLIEETAKTALVGGVAWAGTEASHYLFDALKATPFSIEQSVLAKVNSMPTPSPSFSFFGIDPSEQLKQSIAKPIIEAGIKRMEWFNSLVETTIDNVCSPLSSTFVSAFIGRKNPGMVIKSASTLVGGFLGGALGAAAGHFVGTTLYDSYSWARYRFIPEVRRVQAERQYALECFDALPVGLLD